MDSLNLVVSQDEAVYLDKFLNEKITNILLTLKLEFLNFELQISSGWKISPLFDFLK